MEDFLADTAALDPRANASVDAKPGITRRRCGSGWTLLNLAGASIRDPAARLEVMEDEVV